jgi:hypothetical protein
MRTIGLAAALGAVALAMPAQSATPKRTGTGVHGAWSDPVGACLAHVVSFDPATGALTCTGTSDWTGTWAGSTTWTLTGRQDPVSGTVTGRIDEVFKGRARRAGRGTLTFVEQLTIDPTGNTDIRGHIVRGSAALAGSRGHAHWTGHSNADGSGSGTYSGQWRVGKRRRAT